MVAGLGHKWQRKPEAYSTEHSHLGYMYRSGLGCKQQRKAGAWDHTESSCALFAFKHVTTDDCFWFCSSTLAHTHIPHFKVLPTSTFLSPTTGSTVCDGCSANCSRLILLLFHHTFRWSRTCIHYSRDSVLQSDWNCLNSGSRSQQFQPPHVIWLFPLHAVRGNERGYEGIRLGQLVGTAEAQGMANLSSEHWTCCSLRSALLTPKKCPSQA